MLLSVFGIQGGWGGWPTGNGKKLSSCQAQLGQATCLAVAYFFSISCGPSTPSALYIINIQKAKYGEILMKETMKRFKTFNILGNVEKEAWCAHHRH